MTLAEIAVLIGIVAIVLAVGTPAYFRYRAHQAVNAAAETTEGLLSRSREEAKSLGFALPSDLVSGGVQTAAAAGRFGADGRVIVRIRKRYKAGEPAQIMSSKDLSLGSPLEVEVVGLGKVDLDADAGLEGIYFEILVNNGSTTEILAAIPIEVNGEFILQGNTAEGAIRLSSADYSRTVTVTHRGVINPDRR